MSSRGEAALVKAAQQGDQRAQQELVAAYLPLVYNVVGRALGGHADVDDVVQETMIRALAGLGSLRDPEGFRSWLVAIAMNRVRSHRAAPAEGALHEAYDVPDPGADFVGLTILRLGLSGQRREVAEAARWLDPDDRDLLSLWWLEAAGRLTRAEVAAAMELTPQHTAVRVQRMKERLEAARVVVRALSAVPRCVLLDDLVASWDGVPSALWRKRLARHTRDCTVCGGLGAGLAPAEGLLVGLSLVPLGGALAALTPQEYVALAADARAAGAYGDPLAVTQGAYGDPHAGTPYGDAPISAAGTSYGDPIPAAGTPYGDPISAAGTSYSDPIPAAGTSYGAPDTVADTTPGGRLQQRQRQRRTRRRRVAVAVVAALVAGGGTAALLIPGDGDDVRRAPTALKTPGAESAMAAPVPSATRTSASPSASPSPSPSRSVSASPRTKAPTRKPTPTPTPTPTRTTARPTPPPSTPEEKAPTGSYAAQVLELVNAERAKAGCSPVRQNSTLDVAAQRHSDDMAARGFFDHTNPDGEDPGDRMTAAGYRWSTYAENIARGQQTAADVMRAWMDSPGHRANILNCSVEETGLGVHEGAGGPWWTQVFGTAM